MTSDHQIGSTPVAKGQAGMIQCAPAPHEYDFSFADPMKFSHIVIINDPNTPLIEPLSVQQVWRGLVLRAEKPEMFVPWLDACVITARSEQGLERELRFGASRIRDQVTFHAPLQVQYHVPAQQDIPLSSLSMRIEIPQQDVLIVRFEYEDEMPESADPQEKLYQEIRCSAYREADIDTVRTIRELAAQGRLDSDEQ